MIGLLAREDQATIVLKVGTVGYEGGRGSDTFDLGCMGQIVNLGSQPLPVGERH